MTRTSTKWALRVAAAVLLAVVLCSVCAHSGVQQAPQKSARSQKSLARIPFVGCRADGQVGPVDAPKGKARGFSVPPEAAARLAFYKAEQGPGVLGPRGWYCFEVYGSNGGSLFVTPEPIMGANLFSNHWSGFAGPAIQISDDFGGTSGRFEVAAVIARVFPAHRQFAEKIIKEQAELGDTNSYPFGPYPADKVVYKNDEIVEYETPGNTDGLGTDSRLRKNGDPISGVAILVGETPRSVSETPDLIHLSIRLPAEMSSLTSAIIEQVERDAARADSD